MFSGVLIPDCIRLSSVTVTLPEKKVDFTSLEYWCRPGGTIAAITSALPLVYHTYDHTQFDGIVKIINQT